MYHSWVSCLLLPDPVKGKKEKKTADLRLIGLDGRSGNLALSEALGDDLLVLGLLGLLHLGLAAGERAEVTAALETLRSDAARARARRGTGSRSVGRTTTTRDRKKRRGTYRRWILGALV